MASVRLGTFRRARAPAAAQISPQQHPMMLIVSALPWFSQAGLELEEKRNAITITCPLPGMQGVAGFRDTNLVGRLRIVQLIIGLSAATVQGEGRRLSLSLIHGPIVAQLGLLGAWKSILAKNDYDGNVLMRGGVLEECGKWCPWGFSLSRTLCWKCLLGATVVWLVPLRLLGRCFGRWVSFFRGSCRSRGRRVFEKMEALIKGQLLSSLIN